jgi:general secretion pathway protein J
MNRTAACSRGFTLIEVLVSVALLALIATILVASLQLGGHTWQRVTRLAASSEDIAQAQAFLRERLGTVYPDTHVDGPLATPSFLVSDGSSLEFSGFAPAASTGALLRYQIAVRGERGALTVRARRDSPSSSVRPSADGTDETLVRDVASLTLQFWQESADSPGRWVNSWSAPKDLPRLIRIDVNFPPGDPREWPSLYVEPRVDTAVDCQFDVVSRRCRGTT